MEKEHKRKHQVWEGKDGMRKVKSCGVLVFRNHPANAKLEFLLMKHAVRWDLPKGHCEEGETDLQTALREMEEETGIKKEEIEIDKDFLFKDTYYPTYKRFGNEKVEKELIMFLGILKSNKDISITEHKGFEWVTWNPPHSIQKNTIDPLLQKIQEHLKNNHSNLLTQQSSQGNSSRKSDQYMIAVVADQPGDAGVLKIQNIPKPSFNATEDKDYVLVNIKATAVNRADVLQRKGFYPPPPGESNIFGLEMSGVVEQVGQNYQHKWKIGDRVCALLGSGGYAEYVKVHGDMLMQIPDRLSFEEAAAIPEVWLTAYQALFWLGEFDSRVNDRTVLVHAGASGVGTAAIQLAKLGQNNRVFVTAGSDDKIEFCKRLGTHDGFNYKKVDFSAEVLNATQNKGVDMLMDFVGANYWDKNLECLGMDGIMTMQGFLGGSKVKESNLAPILGKRLQIKGSSLRNRSLDYKIKLTKSFSEFAMPKFQEGRLKPIISKTYSLQEVSESHRFMEADKNIGKIILSIARAVK